MSPSKPTTSVRRWWVPALAAVVAVGLIVTVISMNSSDPSDDGGDTAAGGLVDQERRSPDDLLALGPIDAPVGLIVFSDFQCPFCARWSEETLPSMVEFAEQGTLRIEWRDISVFGPESDTAARAAHAAARQDRYLDFHAALFPDGDIRSKADLSETVLVELADDLGLDRERFEHDMGSDETRRAVDRNAAQAAAIGAHATPTFILNGAPIVGAQPTAVFVDAVSALASARRS